VTQRVTHPLAASGQNSPPISVDIATPDQLRDIRPLIAAHIAYERSAATLPPDWHERIACQLTAGRMTLFVARAGVDAVGYASLTTDVSTWSGEEFAHLDCIYVAELHRGAGLGRRLIGAVTDAARARGLGELQWQTPHWNDGAIRFYERLGATHSAKERFTLGLE